MVVCRLLHSSVGSRLSWPRMLRFPKHARRPYLAGALVSRLSMRRTGGNWDLLQRYRSRGTLTYWLTKRAHSTAEWKQPTWQLHPCRLGGDCRPSVTRPWVLTSSSSQCELRDQQLLGNSAAIALAKSVEEQVTNDHREGSPHASGSGLVGASESQKPPYTTTIPSSSHMESLTVFRIAKAMLGDKDCLSNNGSPKTVRVYYAMTPSPRNSLILALSIPRTSERISSVCCPRVGGGMRIPGFDPDHFTGVLTSLIGPHDG